MKTLVVASSNPGKLREIRRILGVSGWDARPQSEFGVPESDEPHPTFIENALSKARHAAQLTGLPALADDSGICVDALGGMPGVQSARFAGEPRSDERNNRKLLAALDGKTNRKAHYYCIVVLLRAAFDPEPLIGEGVWEGEIAHAARGAGGFGYDPLFLVPGTSRSSAELPPEEKNQISHRGLALAALMEKLRGDRI